MKPTTRQTANAILNAVETEAVEIPEVVETPEAVKANAVETEAVKAIKSMLSGLSIEEVKEIDTHIKSMMDAIQQEKIKQLMEQKRLIDEQLKAFNVVGESVSDHTPIVNPNNPAEIYRMGKQPDWLKALMAETGKSVKELRAVA